MCAFNSEKMHQRAYCSHQKKNIFLNFICFLLFFLFANLWSAAAFSSTQSTKLNIQLTEGTMLDFIKLVEKQSAYTFVYDVNEVNLNQKISLNVSDRPIEEVLKEAFYNKALSYKITDHHIALFKTQYPQQPTKRITGHVKDESGLPVIGANIVERGTNNGTVSDFDGNFHLIVSEKSILDISFIGYISQSLRAENQNSFSIVLKEDNEAIDEVVVVGYGTQKKVSVTGSLAAMSGTEITKVPTVSVANSLTGRLPGLIATNKSGEPGYDDSDLLIRGRSTTGDSSPLVVVDGVADRAGGFSRIDPNDIESITVLKDASAAIYGSRAANGVLLITTKRGKQGRTSVNYSGNIGFSRPTVLPEMAESWQYAQLQNEIERSIYGRSDKYTTEQIQKFRDGSDPSNYPNINVFDETLRNAAPQTQHNLSVSGGNDLIKFFVSAGYQYQENYYKRSASDYTQYNLRSNIDITPHKNFQAMINIAARQENRNSPLYSSEDIWRYMVKYDPMVNIYWPGTNYPTTASQDNFSPATAVDGSMGYQKDQASYFNADITLHYDMPFILKGLSVDGGLYIDRDDKFYKNFAKQFELYQKNGDTYTPKKYGPSNATLNENMKQTLGLTLNARINYEQLFNHVHNVKAFVAYEQYTSHYDYLQAYRQDFISSMIDQMFAGDKTTAQNDGTATETARLNFFGRVDYDYKGKYLAQFNWRYDGSENFPKGKRFGFFPGVSLGWRISEERFWQENISWIDYMKIRASYGQMGNDKVSAFQYMTTYTFKNPAILGGNNPKPQTGIWQNRTANPNITWEVATTYNIGLESRFLADFNLELDLFKTKRTNILAARSASIPQYGGLTLPDENIGECSSQGLELMLNYSKKINDFQISIGGNITYATSNIDFIDEADGVVDWQKRTNKPIGADWLMYEAIGIFRTQADLDKYPHLSNAKLGDIIFRDVDDNQIIDGDDKVRLDKSYTPEIIYGINFGLDWKQWSLSGLFQGAGRVWQYTFFESGTIGNFTKDFYENRWTEENINAKYPRVYDRETTVTGQKNTFWLNNASYLRLKNIELAYSFSSDLLTKTPFSNARIYISGYNLLTFTKMKNLDPETREGEQGFAAWSTPQSKVVNLGVNLTF